MHRQNCQRFSLPLVVLLALCSCTGLHTAAKHPAPPFKVPQQPTFPDQSNRDELDRRLLETERVQILGPNGEKAYSLPAPQRIAHFNLPEGRTVSFLYSAITNDLIYEEEVNDGASPLFDASASMLERYVTLAAKDAPVPSVLIELDNRLSQTDKERLTTGRDVSTMPLESVNVSDEFLKGGLVEQLADSPTAALGVTPSCQNAVHFATTHCYYLNHSLVLRNRHDPIWCCDENYPSACGYNPSQGNTWWFKLTRRSGAWRKNSYSTVAACGTSVFLEHWWKAWGTWWTFDNRDQIVPENKVYYKFVMGGAWYERRITYRRQTESGGFRAYSEFSNP